MSDVQVDEQMVRNYLLGALPDQEKVRVDELILTDDDVAERLRAVENDLVDSYVRGQLSGDALVRFKSHYLVAPGHQQKVKIAQGLMIFFDRASERESVLPASKNKQPFRAHWLAAAAIVILLSTYLVFENIRLRNQILQRQAEFESLSQRERQLQNQLDQQSTSVSETEKELSRVRERLAKLEQQTALKNEVKQIAFYLSAPTRTISTIPVLAIPAGTEMVILNLQMEAEKFRSYRAKLKNAKEPKDLWISTPLQRRDDSLEIPIPAAVLKTPQTYLLEISGIHDAGSEKLLTGYSFRLVTSNR